MTRKGFKSGELMVVLVTLGEELCRSRPSCCCVLKRSAHHCLVQNINGDAPTRILGDKKPGAAG